MPETALSLLDYRSERDLLVDSFTHAGRDVRVEFHFATAKSLQRALMGGATALHYSGHGTQEALAFEDDKGSVHMLDVQQLRHLFESTSTRRKVQFVFVSACFSLDIGRAFVAAGVPSVVACSMDDRVSDTGARTFEDAFYVSLARGDTVSQAFQMGRQAVATSTSAIAREDTDKFRLLPEDSEHLHNISVFGAAKHLDRRWDLTSGYPSVPGIPQCVEGFQGRNVEMFTILDHLHRGRCVTVTGGAGVGKRALVTALANYVLERGSFRDAVLWVPASGLRTVEQLHEAVAAAARREPGIPPEALLAGLQCLLILEGCDALHEHSVKAFGAFLERVLHEQGVSVVSTAAHEIGILTDVIEKVVPLSKLKPYDQAILFTRRAPRRIRPKECGCSTQKQLIAWLTANKKLNNMSPTEVVKAAKQLVNSTVPQVLWEDDNSSGAGALAEGSRDSGSGGLRPADDVRFFEAELPSVGDMVAVEVDQMTEHGAFGKLLQYGVVRGLILQKEVSRRQMNSSSHFRVGRKEFVRVIKVDTKNHTVDMSKRKVTEVDKESAKRQYNKSQVVRKIITAVSSARGASVAELFSNVVWPLNRSHGHAYDAFRSALSDRSILDELGLAKGVHDALFELIRDEMSQQLSKVAQQNKSKELDLSGWGLKSLLQCFLELHTLRTLNLESNKLIGLPTSIGNLHQLEELNLNNNPLLSLPHSLPDMSNLRRLYLHSAVEHCHEDAIRIILRMGSLVELNLSSNRLFSHSRPEPGFLPVEFGSALAGLESLGLNGNCVESLDQSCFEQMQQLTFLDLSNNRLSQVPELAGLGALTTLNLKGNTLMSLVPLGGLQKLDSLICSSNRLVDLPSLAPLEVVQYLDFSHNQITSLGKDIANCQCLVDLDLSHNQLEMLPIELASIASLERCMLGANPLKMVHPELEKFLGSDNMTDLRRQFSQNLFETNSTP